ncbi:extracellular catalytic domain type 1 short-chain-length polyhydroxyalkanoate depolymerase [Pseudochelatococcus sp. B33]
MTGIASTTANLALWRLQWETLFSLPHLLDESEMDDEEGCRLSEVENFGDNPGNLRMFQYVPEGLAPQAPLVVVLHGCTQTAPGYDRSSGWSWLAEEHGFAVLFAQQRGENNPRRCFNWFRPSDITRDLGEAASIRQMVGFLAEQHDLDRQRIFITGLSAGGAMANVMLATYPDVFAAGAIIAGLPYRSAVTVHDALQVMMDGATRSPTAWGDEVRAASPLGDLTDSRIAMPWPRVAVWQGLGDDVVKPSNAVEIVKQWTDVHGLSELATEEEDVGGTKRMRWRDADGEVVIEAVAIEHLGHAVPIAAARADLHEQPGPHFADIGLSSTLEIARFFGLLADEPASRDKKPVDKKPIEEKAGAAVLSSALAALPPVLRGRRPRARGREGAGRTRPAVSGLPPPAVPDDEGPPVPPAAPQQAEAPPQAEPALAERVALVSPPPAAALPPEQREAQGAETVATVEKGEAVLSAPDTGGGEAVDAGQPAARGILARIARLLGLTREK